MEIQEFLKFISLLLQYPTEEIQSIARETEIVAYEDDELSGLLKMFTDYLQNNPLIQLQENYVHTFDFNEKTSLYLTYSKMGDEKERGQILAELKQIYAFAGFELNTTELPDYLPLLLEFAAHTHQKTREDLLQRFREAIAHSQQMLAKNKSPYANLLKGLLIIIDRFILKEV